MKVEKLRKMAHGLIDDFLDNFKQDRDLPFNAFSFEFFREETKNKRRG